MLGGKWSTAIFEHIESLSSAIQGGDVLGPLLTPSIAIIIMICLSIVGTARCRQFGP